MIAIIKTVREIYNKLSGKEQLYLDGFYDCLTFFIIGFDKSDQHNLHLIIRQLQEDNAVLRSLIYKLKKHRSLVTDENVQIKLSQLQELINIKDRVIAKQKEQLMYTRSNAYVPVNQKVL